MAFQSLGGLGERRASPNYAALAVPNNFLPERVESFDFLVWILICLDYL